MVINQLVLQIFNFYLVIKLIFSSFHSLIYYSDANINAQQTAAANQRLLFTSNNTPDHPTPSDNPFRSDCENPSNDSRLSVFTNQFSLLDDLLNDNTNMSTVSLSSKIDYLPFLFDFSLIFL